MTKKIEKQEEVLHVDIDVLHEKRAEIESTLTGKLRKRALAAIDKEIAAATKKLEDGDVEQIEASDVDAPADGDDVAANDEQKPAKVKTWMGAQVERMRRAVQHNNLTAQVVRANFEIAKLTEKEADALAKQIEKHTSAAKSLIEDFLGKIPEAHEGITPSKTGERQAPRNLMAGVKVTLKPEAYKSYGALFSVEELADLTVIAASGKMVRLVTPSKATLMIESKNILSAAPVVAAA